MVYGLSLQDPTVIFVLIVLICPAVLSGSFDVALGYLTTPMLLLSYIFLALVLFITHHTNNSEIVKLNSKDLMIANWFLMN
eukprot:Pgem_evm1s11230